MPNRLSETVLPPMARCAALSVTLALCAAGSALGQAGGGPVYKCPGPPVLYTDALSPAQARERGCQVIESGPVTVVQSRKPAAGAAATPSGRASTPDTRVDSGEQRGRDLDARRILEAELRKEEDGLAALQREFNNGEPERRGDERNFQKYNERIGEMRAAIARKQADIDALRRELSKLPAS